MRALREASVEAVAVCLLHSYLNPAHERRIKAIVEEEFPEAYLSVSHEVLPLYREYERFSTVCLNAYIGPRVARYVERFAKAMTDAGFANAVQLMQSSGGTVGPEAAVARPVSLLMSGPVAGLIGGIWAGRMAGHENVITLDMGGTSADIGVAPGGELRMRHLVDTTVGRIPGDGADGRRRHDRRRRRLDRLRRRGRRLPRRPAIGRRRPGPGLLRTRRRRADLDRRAAPARTAAAGGAARRPDAPRPRAGREAMRKVAAKLGVTTRKPRSASCRSRSSA